VPSIGIREFRARTSEVVRQAEEGLEFTITRHGKPCAKLGPADSGPNTGRRAPSLYGKYPELPDLDWEDFVEAKRILHPKPLDG